MYNFEHNLNRKIETIYIKNRLDYKKIHYKSNNFNKIEIVIQI